jgi:diguanylate cyclase (GGDEF)-like protein
MHLIKINNSKEKFILATQTLFFLLLAILIHRVLKHNSDISSLYSLSSSLAFIILISLIPLIRLVNTKYVFFIDLWIIFIYILITSCLLYFENEDIFKILFLMPVVISALRYPIKFSYSITIFVLFFLFLIGFLNNFSSIDADIMLSGVLFLLAWLLGNMTETEAKIRKELERLATHDSLTDILNHRSFQALLDEKLEEAKKENTSISLILLDIDFFKVYNDSLGHQKGDQVLKEVADILKNATKEIGYCARYGGEEFVIILPKTGIKAAKALAEEIRRKVEETEFPGIDLLPKGKLTISIGIAEFPSMADNKERLIQKADEALYKAKFVSKNKVETYFSVFDELSLSLKDEEKELFNSIRTLTMVINAKDRYTYGHSERVMEMAKKFAEIIGLDEQQTKDIIFGSLLHDIGKIEISREVLNKPTKLNDLEWQMTKQHPQWGADIIRPLKSLKGSLDIVLYHHENYNGTGYPKGLKGEEIPFGARLLRIIDSYDALTSHRPYKEAMSQEQAIEELQKYSGIHYDPEMLEKFCKMILESKWEMPTTE